jgi:adenylate cyclase
VGDALSAVGAVGVGAVGPLHAMEQAALPTYRFHLQPMWRRPVRGLGLVEPWLLTRRTDHV